MHADNKPADDVPFALRPAKVGRKSWKPAFVISGQQMEMFVGAKDQPNQGLLFGEVSQEAKAIEA